MTALSRVAVERLLTGWNRNAVAFESDESVVQVLDRGGLDAWRELSRWRGGTQCCGPA